MILIRVTVHTTYNYLSYTAEDNIRCTRNNSYIQSTSNVISKSFFHKPKQLWLNLPIDIQEIDSRNSFKSQLFKLYLEKQCQENIPANDVEKIKKQKMLN